MARTRDGEIGTLLAVPNSFRTTALSFPDRVQQALALVETAEQAAELLDKAEVMSQFARRVRADTECINAIQGGKLLIVAKLGDLLPKGEPGRPKNGEPKTIPPTGIISKNTATSYRKVSSAADKIKEYREAVEAKNAAQNIDKFLEAIQDWAILDGCFGGTTIKPSDIDGFVERNGVCLFLEGKGEGVPLKTGQGIAFKSLAKQGNTVIVFWGRDDGIYRMRIITANDPGEVQPATLQDLRNAVSAWYDAANARKRS